MNQYKAFYNNMTRVVEAETSFEAVKIAREQFKAPKSKQHMVSVVLMRDSNGNPVAVNPASL